MAAACLLPSVLLGTAVGAPAGSPQAGYWWVPEPVSGLIPVPGVPADGVYVASSPSGPQAESAIRFPVVDQIAYISLTLKVSNQERVGTPAVVGYPATSGWQTGGPQPWSARPSYRATTTPAKGAFSDGGTKMTIVFPAEEAQQGIVLVPDPNATSTTFSVAFAPPTSADVRMVPTPHPSVDATHGRVGPSHHPTAGTTKHPTAAADSPTSHPISYPRTTKTPSPRSSQPPRSTPGSLSPTPSAQSAPAVDHDHPLRDVILISAMVAAVVLLLSVWRTARRG